MARLGGEVVRDTSGIRRMLRVLRGPLSDRDVAASLVSLYRR